MASVTESIEISAPPVDVFNAVADVSRIGEWSPEATGAQVRRPGPLSAGETFIGRNRSGAVSWSTLCRVTDSEPGVRFAFDVDAKLPQLGTVGISHWHFDITEIPGGCLLTQTWTDRRSGVVGNVVRGVGAVMLRSTNRSEHNRQGMRITLRRLKDSLESDAT